MNFKSRGLLSPIGIDNPMTIFSAPPSPLPLETPIDDILELDPYPINESPIYVSSFKNGSSWMRKNVIPVCSAALITTCLFSAIIINNAIEDALDTPGAKGDQGIVGIQGESGVNGKNGLQGEEGIAGLDGDQGETGAAGSNGIQGEVGASGNDAARAVMVDIAVLDGRAYMALQKSITLAAAGNVSVYCNTARRNGSALIGQQTFSAQKVSTVTVQP